jgi:outer membrane lipoprotein carrier protein
VIKKFVAGFGLLGAAAMVALSIGAEAGEPLPIVKRVEEKYAKVDVMTASFDQTVRSAAFGEEKSKGTLALKRPKKMKWDFGSKMYVFDGQQMWLFSKEENVAYKYAGAQGGDADQLLTSLGSLDTLFIVTELKSAVAGHHSLDLAPRKAEGQMKKVHIELDPDLLVERVVITDAFDTVTDLSFRDLKLNGNVPDSTFVFLPPAGTQVIDASQ